MGHTCNCFPYVSVTLMFVACCLCVAGTEPIATKCSIRGRGRVERCSMQIIPFLCVAVSAASHISYAQLTLKRRRSSTNAPELFIIVNLCYALQVRNQAQQNTAYVCQVGVCGIYIRFVDSVLDGLWVFELDVRVKRWFGLSSNAGTKLVAAPTRQSL